MIKRGNKFIYTLSDKVMTGFIIAGLIAGVVAFFYSF